MHNIFIGGIGGSGTRVLAEIFKQSGFFIGHDLNKSNDNLLFTFLFRRADVLIEPHLAKFYTLFHHLMSSQGVTKREKEMLQILTQKQRSFADSSWLEERYDNLFFKNTKPYITKEPNAHIIIDRLIALDPTIKFIYLYRNGLDMAFSSNQNQLKLWGETLIGTREVTPKNSLAYWVAVHQRLLDLKKMFPTNIQLVSFEELVDEPKRTLEAIQAFSNLSIDLSLTTLISSPATRRRYEKHDLSLLDPKDIEYVQRVYA